MAIDSAAIDLTAGSLAPRRSTGATTRVFDRLALANEVLVVVALVLDIAITFVNTIERYVLNDTIRWAQDASLIAINLTAFLGGAAFYRRGGGMAFTSLADRVSDRSRAVLAASSCWIVILVGLTTLYTFPAFLQAALVQTLPLLGISEFWVTAWMGLGYALIVLYSVEKLLLLSRSGNIIGFALASCVVVLLLFWRWQHAAMLQGIDPIVPMLIGLVFAFVTGASIPFVLAFGSMSFIFVTGAIPVLAVPATFQAGIGSFILVAVPFFLIAGGLMEVSGMAARLVDALAAWCGHWRGGLLITQVFAMYAFSGASGSKAADIACVGSVMRGPLQERGYPPGESVAVLAASAAMGETVPPSIIMLILASITTLSVGGLFLGGLLPAAALALALCVGILIRARGGRLPKGESFHLRRAVVAMPPAIPALLVPIILIGGIVGGIGTPTEVSSFAVVYGLATAVFIYRAMKPIVIWEMLRETALTAGIVLLILTAANLFSQVIVIDGAHRPLIAFLTGFGTRWSFLLLSTIGLVMLGLLLEGLPALIIFGPLLLPVAQQLGIHPLQYGMLMIMAMSIGVCAPPFGIGLYTACVVGRASSDQAFRPAVFYTLFLVAGLAAVVAFPDVTLAVPRLFGFE